ncbi:MAG: FAD-dependent oxidoreductase [Candidatus Marinimicrobia bacterium]|nr:FAD-dependent oxidoreductase [Candidatus Neomarinimicrobiota bacterium]
MIELTINGNKAEFEEGKTLLECIESAGIKILTLCHHKALTPYGACRLCLVEIEQEGRAPSIQASCSYPALNGLSIKTDTDRVKGARKIVAELLLARCPDSEKIQRIASELGVVEPRIEKKYDDCIYCGLCERICRERMGRMAVGFSGRGSKKKVEPPFSKYNEMCWTCGACDFICPVGKKVSELTSENDLLPIPNPYNFGLDEKPAIHILYPQAIPNTPSIDEDKCIYLNYEQCKICEEVCEAKAIDYDQKEEMIDLDVGAVILSPGADLYDPKIDGEFGYKRYPNVITSIEFERILNASGPYFGHVLRPFDKKVPKRIAFIQCVGSRDQEHDYCSSVCCMYATKEAIIAKEHISEGVETDIFFMDVRAFSKGFDEYYKRAQSQGVNYIRCRVPVVKEIPETKNLLIQYLSEDDRKVENEYDLVVLSIGLTPPKTAEQIAEQFDIELNEFDFCKTSVFHPTESTRDGIFVAGPFTEPKDIPETVMQASGAASNILSLLKDVRGSLIVPKEYPPEIDVQGQEPRIGVFVCHCGTNIAGVVNVPDVVEYAKTLPNVVYAENNLYTCSNDTQEVIKEKIIEHNLNRVVVASCTPRTHEPLFRNTLREIGLNPYLFEMANIRDQCSWVHMHEPEKATEKSKDLVRMAIAKVKLLDPLQKRSLEINKSALVIGGGLAGMTSAVELEKQGFDVYLIEKEKQLGGNLNRIHYLLNREKPLDELSSIVKKVNSDNKIHLFTDAKIESLEGSIGNFTTKVSVNGSSKEIEHGIVIVATGASEYQPKEYLYGEDKSVITQLELEKRLSKNGDWLTNTGKQPPKTIVMIQCVGSRNDDRPYCSRVCCTESIKNALKIKEQSPETNVYILYRDIRTYGFRESYYSQARNKDVIFMRYEEKEEPKVSRNGNGLQVEVFDQSLKLPIEISADMVVLSAGIVPSKDNDSIAQFLKVPLDSNGFFLEAHMKLRPVDFATDGVFLCGMAHSAKSIEESIIQAQAAASRAATILSKDSIELEANISQVVDENCDGCAYCIEPCPYNAITLIEYMRNGAVKKTVEVNESACKGCGGCQGTCPKKGILVRGFQLDQIGAQVNAALGVV